MSNKLYNVNWQGYISLSDLVRGVFSSGVVHVTESGLQVWEQDDCCGVIVHKGAEDDITDFLGTDDWDLDCVEVKDA